MNGHFKPIRSLSHLLTGALCLFLLGLVIPASAAVQKISCIQCHGDLATIQDTNSVELVHQFLLNDDVHHSVGLSCPDCHGGNPDPKLGDDMATAMDEKYQPNPFRGAPKRTQTPEFCARCHSDPNFMKRYKPAARVDQLTEYWTSQHGKLIKTGDTNVAVCTDCHGIHNIIPPSHPQSTVYPKNVAETCSKCHSNPRKMAAYKLPNGQPLPVDQYDRWHRSFHAQAMFAKDDLSAPTCNSCHGNHSALPPNLASIVFVCGQCHGRESSLFRDSPKEIGFKEHNETLLPNMGKGGCAECHEPPEPSALITNITQFTKCIVCHGNHSVVSPNVTMLAPVLDTPCNYCHEGVTPILAGFAEPEKIVRHFQAVKAQLLADAEKMGLSGDVRFDWLVDQALRLPFHHVNSAAEAGHTSDFLRLFQKFRIGKTHFTHTDPRSGREVQDKLINCGNCHGVKSKGFQASSAMSRNLHDLAAQTAGAERTLLAAQRGGAEVRRASLQVDKAVAAEIQLEALLHTFSVQSNSQFVQTHSAGIKIARESLSDGLSALRELRYRHQGLLVFLGIALCVLLGIGIMIRKLPKT